MIINQESSVRPGNSNNITGKQEKSRQVPTNFIQIKIYSQILTNSTQTKTSTYIRLNNFIMAMVSIEEATTCREITTKVREKATNPNSNDLENHLVLGTNSLNKVFGANHNKDSGIDRNKVIGISHSKVFGINHNKVLGANQVAHHEVSRTQNSPTETTSHKEAVSKIRNKDKCRLLHHRLISLPTKTHANAQQTQLMQKSQLLSKAEKLHKHKLRTKLKKKLVSAPVDNNSNNKTTLKVLDSTNLSYNEAQVKLLCRSFTFTPTPSPNEIDIKADIQEFCRKLRLREYFLDSHQEPKLVHNKSNFNPPNQRNEELDELIQEITEVNVKKHTPKDNLPRLKDKHFNN